MHPPGRSILATVGASTGDPGLAAIANRLDGHAASLSVGGGLEHLLLGAMPREATILATLQLDAPPMKFKPIAVPGQAAVDLAAVIDPTATWRHAVD